MTYPYLPGLMVDTADGNLQAAPTPSGKSVIVVGTAGQGDADTLYQVLDKATAASIFGFDGSLIRGMEEVSMNADNIYLYRMGTRPGKLEGVGKETGTTPHAGMRITFNDRYAGAGDDYKLVYSAGVVMIWKLETLVYSNSSSNPVDNGIDILIESMDVSGTLPDGGTAIGTGTTLATAVAVKSVASGSGTWTAPVLGTSMTTREVYVAQDKALRQLDNTPLQEVHLPSCVLDAPNVAFNDSTSDSNTLDWLKTWEDTNGTITYHWASESKDSEGATVTAHASWANAAARIADGYHEVNFGYQLARFCHKQEQIQRGQGVCLGFIGMTAPANFNLATIRAWIGKLPTYDSSTGQPTVSGKGQLGNAYMAGCTGDKLHTLCHDKVNPGYRSKGFFDNIGGYDQSGEYDCGATLDVNQRPVDIGAYLRVEGDWAVITNGFGSYVGSIAGVVAGFVSMLDEKSSTTNKPLIGVAQKHKPNLAQLDDYTFIGINMLRQRAAGEPPRLTHGQTAATRASDFDSLVRQRVKGLVVKSLADVADPFIGEANTDGLQLIALKTQLDSKMADLKKRGYIGLTWHIKISATAAQQKIGHAKIAVSFYPPDELNQLDAVVSVNRS